MRKEAYLVIGPESSGTKLMTQCLLMCGCAGNAIDEQPWDLGLENAPDKIVWRRSVPHGPEWPDLNRYVTQLEDKGYLVRVIAMFRNQYCLERSQILQLHVKTLEESRERIKRAMEVISNFLADTNVEYQWMTYETIVHEPEAVKAMLGEWFNFPALPSNIFGGNCKHYTNMKVTQ